jgi:type II secretory pathway pseudopilin PulG
MINKKGAMFGLDARIALAIFGALSVISGAALYSAIQTSNATAILVEMQEIAKAYEQYYLDTGSILIEESNVEMQSKGLVEDNGVVGWKGPYLSYEVVPSNYVMKHPKYNHIHISRMSTGQDWGSAACTDPKDCYFWVTMNGMPKGSISAAIDEMVDGGDGLTVGNFQTTHSDGIYHLKILNTAYP